MNCFVWGRMRPTDQVIVNAFRKVTNKMVQILYLLVKPINFTNAFITLFCLAYIQIHRDNRECIKCIGSSFTKWSMSSIKLVKLMRQPFAFYFMDNNVMEGIKQKNIGSFQGELNLYWETFRFKYSAWVYFCQVTYIITCTVLRNC